jgi:hypothetical protein
VIRNGADVRVSTPVNTASSIANPGICRANTGNASRIAAIA